MSTRCNIHFTDRTGEVEANIYRHGDGYPEGVLPDLEKFFAAVEAQTRDTRYNDPSYLAAKFVVWQAWESAQAWAGVFSDSAAPAPLAFLSVGIMSQDAGDGAYVYTVTCHGDGRPTVTYREA